MSERGLLWYTLVLLDWWDHRFVRRLKIMRINLMLKVLRWVIKRKNVHKYMLFLDILSGLLFPLSPSSYREKARVQNG
jgi:hypothetical protein